MARVELTNHLYQFFPDLEGREIEVEGDTVARILEGMERIAPGFGFYVRDERGRLRQHVNVFVGSEPVADRHGLSDAVPDDARVLILQALSGG